MKRSYIARLALIAVTASALLFSGCSGENVRYGSENAASGDLLSRIQEKGEIVIAMEGTWAPWTYHDEEDELVGYDVEVGRLIAEKLGVEPIFVEGAWDGLLAGIDAGRYDIMINGSGCDPERQEAYDFPSPMPTTVWLS